MMAFAVYTFHPSKARFLKSKTVDEEKSDTYLLVSHFVVDVTLIIVEKKALKVFFVNERYLYSLSSFSVRLRR